MVLAVLVAVVALVSGALVTVKNYSSASRGADDLRDPGARIAALYASTSASALWETEKDATGWRHRILLLPDGVVLQALHLRPLPAWAVWVIGGFVVAAGAWQRPLRANMVAFAFPEHAPSRTRSPPAS